jgi:hypothetical protein
VAKGGKTAVFLYNPPLSLLSQGEAQEIREGI